MNREIKFRGYSKLLNQIFDFNNYDFFISINVNHQFECYREYEKSGELLIEHLIPMQYTGLKDKNGKEIFEGDILNFKANYCSMEKTTGWQNAKVVITEYQLELHNAVGETYPANDETDEFPYTAEIIGNIYENPELIT